jgi:two-component system cell cycle response regulator
MFDIDHFKKVNDTHGHPGGDAIQTDLSSLMMISLRTEDIFARYGGEEFAVICRGSDLAQAQVIGERLRRAAEGRQFKFQDKIIPVTISVGVAALPDPNIKDAGAFVMAADGALYRSKQGGRNRVSLHMSV